MAGVFLKKGGKKEYFLEEEVEKALADGWVAASDVAVDVSGTGRASLVSAEDFTKVQDFSSAAAGKGELVSQEQVNRAVEQDIKEETFNTLGNEALAFGSGALSAATFGLSDKAISALGGQEKLRDISEINPLARGAGEITGAIGSAFLGGTAAARFLPGAAATKASGAVRGAVAARHGKTAGLVAEGVVDGALFGAGQAYADAVISDEPVNAEKIIAGMGSGALFGGAIGGAVGGLGKLSKRIDIKKAAQQSDAFRSTQAGREITKIRRKLDRDLTKFIKKEVPENLRVKTESTLKEAVDSLGDDFLSSSAENVNNFATKLKELHPHVGAPKFDIDGLALKLGDDVPNLNKPIRDAATGELTSTGKLLQSEGVSIEAISNSPVSEAVAKLWASKQAARKSTKAIATKPTGLTGLVGQLTSGPSGVIGSARRLIDHGRSAIGESVERFIRVAGKPRKGTVPAATTVLGKIRFDNDVGVKPKQIKSRLEAFNQFSERLNKAAGNPEVVKQNLERNFAELSQLKPAVGDMAIQKALARLQYLHGVMPKSPNVEGFAPDNWQPTSTELGKFTRIVRAAEDPYTILEDMETGRLTQEAVDTVKNLYPEIYREIQLNLVERADEIRKNVGRQGRNQLSVLFQAPVSAIYEPSMIQNLQLNYMQRELEAEQGGTGNFSTPGSTQQFIASQATQSQRIAAK